MKNIVLIIVVLIIVGACGYLQNRKHDVSSATIFMVHDNYPKGYKTVMGELSYTREILLVFYITNHTEETQLLPISDNTNSDTCFIIRVNGNSSIDIPCTYYWKRNPRISSGDSIAFAFRLYMSDLEKLEINLDEKTIEDCIPSLSFECYHNKNGVLEPIEIEFKLSSKILYKHGRLFVEYRKDGTQNEKEIYEDSNDIAIVKYIHEQ